MLLPRSIGLRSSERSALRSPEPKVIRSFYRVTQGTRRPLRNRRRQARLLKASTTTWKMVLWFSAKDSYAGADTAARADAGIALIRQVKPRVRSLQARYGGRACKYPVPAACVRAGAQSCVISS